MFRRIKQYVFLGGCIVLIAGCASLDLETPTSGFAFGSQQDMTKSRDLAPGDGVEVSVEVDGNMEVSSHRAEINHQGLVTLPLVGDVKIGGMKLSAARDTIAKTYGAYYVNPPVVMLSLLAGGIEGEWGYVTVLGRVNQPGRVPLPSQSGINLSAAVQLAGGFAPSAKTGDIRISRTDELGLTTRISVDFEQIGRAGNADADVLLTDGDIVYVPERIF